ncbi:hypothetical protein NIIDMKKI_34100 [Mycobacterium kansasii]|uniref:Major facilitator superfamily (MFS) profile domain-containing protein n=1 Tax=Mycobacterium kansasii TaxID=1768 RepID=A0A7G1ICN5_MYCKA|nr:hypothetical protein NIIDMKKI_34100 [Mycobacterium kansasii]
MTSPTASRTAAADTRSTCISLSPARRNIIFMALMLGVLVAAMDQTIVVPALPTIVDELGVSVHQSWAITSYLLGGTIVVVVAGKLGTCSVVSGCCRARSWSSCSAPCSAGQRKP